MSANKRTGAVLLLIGIVALLLFMWVDPAGWKALLLSFAVMFILESILRLSVLPLFSLPEGDCYRLATSAAIASGALYYILCGQSVICIAPSVILLLWGAMGLLSQLQGILAQGVMLRALLKAHEEGESPDLVVPLIYVLGEPGAGVRFGHKIVIKALSSLMKHRNLHAKPGLPPMLYILSDSVRRYPVSFRKWAVSQAAAFLVIRTSMATGSLVETFDDEAKSGYQTCPGPTFMVYFRVPPDDSPLPMTTADQILEQTVKHRIVDSSLVTHLTGRLASTAVPIGVSDTQLTKEARSLIQDVATSALPPIADCYLRLRLAQSDVERFFSLFEGLECLVKCSVIILLVNRWDQTGKDVSSIQLVGRPPTLGAWIYFLKKLTDTVVPIGLAEELRSFWSGGMFQVQKDLINEASEMGLPLDTKRTSQLDWLEWFRDLRNVTRGHGVVTEESVASLWHPFHEAFLEMISALKPFILTSVLVAKELSGKQVPLRGWLRGGSRVGAQSAQEPQEHGAIAALKLPSHRLLSLHPLVIIRGNEVLLWDCVRKREKAIEFLNYASGEREQLAFSEFCDTDPYKIWLEADRM